MDEFRSMTLREIQISLRQINKRTSQKNRFEAAIHGVKLEVSVDDEVAETNELSEEQQEKIDNDMRGLAMRKQMEMSKNGRSKR